MDFELSDEQKDIKKAARKFAEGELRDTASISFSDVRIPQENLVGAEGEGFT